MAVNRKLNVTCPHTECLCQLGIGLVFTGLPCVADTLIGLPGAGPDPIYQDFVDIWDGIWTQKDLPVLTDRRKAGQRIWYCGGLGAPANPVVDSLIPGTTSVCPAKWCPACG